MTTPITALGVGPLRWKAIITNGSNPSVGDINVYNTIALNASFAVTLPVLNPGGTVGGVMHLEKDPSDGSTHTITFSCSSGDLFTDGSSSLALVDPGQSRLLQIVDYGSGLRWKILGGLGAPTTLSVSNEQSFLPIVIALG